jgi:hypothetical protein
MKARLAVCSVRNRALSRSKLDSVRFPRAGSFDSTALLNLNERSPTGAVSSRSGFQRGSAPGGAVDGGRRYRLSFLQWRPHYPNDPTRRPAKAARAAGQLQACLAKTLPALMH